MAKVSKAESIEAVIRELPDEIQIDLDRAILEDIWLYAGLDHYPMGLDQYLLWTSHKVGYATAQRWLGIILGVPEDTPKFWIEATKRLRFYQDLQPVIDGIEMFHRRRLRAEPTWDENRSAWVNGLIRAKSRAIKMLGRSAAEVAA